MVTSRRPASKAALTDEEQLELAQKSERANARLTAGATVQSAYELNYGGRKSQRDALEQEARDLREQLDAIRESIKVSAEAWADDLASAFGALRIPADGGSVVPAVLRFSFDELIAAIGDDELLVLTRQPNGTFLRHHYAPPGSDDNRRCLISQCAATFRWPSEPVAVLRERDAADGPGA